MVHNIVSKFEKIWLRHALKIIRKSKSPYFLRERGHSSGTVNVKYTVIDLNRETTKKEGLIEKSEKQRKRRG
jgi:hypothetical protein